MASRGRPKASLILSDDERRQLASFVRLAHVDRQLAFRARLVLACADGLDNCMVARILRTQDKTVGRWRQRFVEHRLQGLNDLRRERDRRQLGELAEEPPAPDGLAHEEQLATQPLGDASGHDLLQRARDVVGLYMSPPCSALVLAVEKDAADASSGAPRALEPGRGGPRRAAPDLREALNVATVKLLAARDRRHYSRSLVSFWREVTSRVPPDLELHAVMNDASSTLSPSVQRWLLCNPRLRLHFTVKHSSWLNVVERSCERLGDDLPPGGAEGGIAHLQRAIAAYVESRDSAGASLKWVTPRRSRHQDSPKP